MAKQKKIQDRDWLYSFLRPYTDLVLRLSYRRIRYVGRERIPKDGAVIYAPNHVGALMDAMVVLAMDRSPKVFVARADIFKNPTLAKIFHFLKIMPIMRMRDGIDEVKKNNETIERAVDVLRDRIPFCIFPEGQHQAKYSALPLSKGIFRIAMQAHELMPETPLYIVPLGLRYGNFFRFRGSLRVQVGEPINVGEFLAQHPDLTPQEQINAMREVLEERIHSSIYYIPNDENYEATHEICAAVVHRQRLHLKHDKEYGHLRGMDLNFEANNMTVKHLEYLKQANPELAQRLFDLAREARKERKQEEISLKSVAMRFPVVSTLVKLLIFILTLPYTLTCSVANLPLTLLSNSLNKRFKDMAFHNSVRYVINLVGWPLLMILSSAIAYIVAPWQWALPITLALLPAPILAHEGFYLLRIIVSDLKFNRNKGLVAKYNKIRDLMFENNK